MPGTRPGMTEKKNKKAGSDPGLFFYSSFRGAPTGRRSAPPDDRLRVSPES
jgi:hypothetical protein